jgi:hypothetical protein
MGKLYCDYAESDDDTAQKLVLDLRNNFGRARMTSDGIEANGTNLISDLF